MISSRRHLWLAFLALVVLALLFLAVLWVPRVRPQPPVIAPVIAIACADIRLGCRLPEARLNVRFDRQPSPLQPFKLLVEVPAARAIHASFNMREMEMGFSHYRLLPNGAGRWSAEVTLPACVQGRKDWLLRLDIDGQRYEVPFSSG